MDRKRTQIDAILEAENLPTLPAAPSELKKIELTPSAEALALAAKKKKENWEEKREFTRANISENSLFLNFANQEQFAKHYIENISLGGLFVKTKNKPGLGAIIPIEFSVPLDNFTEKKFSFRCKVCRQTDSGLGLEFLDMTHETRSELENFIQGTLPEGIPVVNQVRKATRERLEQLRLTKVQQETGRQKIVFRIGFAIALTLFNIYLTYDLVEDFTTAPVNQSRPEATIGGQKVELNKIQSVQRTAHGSILVQLSSGDSIELRHDEINSTNLPAYFLQSVENLHLNVPRKKVRTTKNPQRPLSR